MSDEFLAIPDQLIGATMFPQEAVDWLAFGPPDQGLRSTLTLDDQILCAHTAAGVLLMAMWSGDLPTYVRSPSTGSSYQVPAIYWDRQTPESIQSAMKRPELPDLLPGYPRPLDPRYGINLPTYPHRLPTSDIVGQVVAFRRAEIERHCVIAGPVFQWKLKAPEGPFWSLYEAAAWIATSDPVLVEQQVQFYERHPSPKNAGAVTWLVLQEALKTREPAAQLMNLENARRCLRAACEAGTVAATGIPVLGDDLYGDRRAIAATEFIGVELWPGKGGSLHRIIQGRGEPARWLELRFSEANVRGIPGKPFSAVQQPSEPLSSSQHPNALPKPVRCWTEEEMTQAIKDWVAQASSRDREVAWRNHFKALQPEHGWGNQSFREHWPIANGSVGKPGRPNPAQ